MKSIPNYGVLFFFILKNSYLNPVMLVSGITVKYGAFENLAIYIDL